MALLALALALTAEAMPARPPDSLAARAAVRGCLSLEAGREESLDACRQAASLGLHPQWSVAIRLYLARRLAALGRWDEVVEIYRRLADEQPLDAGFALRLGSALLFGQGRLADAEAALRAALARDEQRAEAWALLGTVLSASGRGAEAAASFERARALDAEYLDARPALLEIEQAAQSGAGWP